MVRFWWIKQEVWGWDVLATSEITCYVVSLLLRDSHSLYLKTSWWQNKIKSLHFILKLK